MYMVLLNASFYCVSCLETEIFPVNLHWFVYASAVECFFWEYFIGLVNLVAFQVYITKFKGVRKFADVAN